MLSFLLELDTSAAHCRFVTGLELLAAFFTLKAGTIPFSRMVGGCRIFEDPTEVISGGLMRHTVASAMSILKQ